MGEVRSHPCFENQRVKAKYSSGSKLSKDISKAERTSTSTHEIHHHMVTNIIYNFVMQLMLCSVLGGGSGFDSSSEPLQTECIKNQTGLKYLGHCYSAHILTESSVILEFHWWGGGLGSRLTRNKNRIMCPSDKKLPFAELTNARTVRSGHAQGNRKVRRCGRRQAITGADPKDAEYLIWGGPTDPAYFSHGPAHALRKKSSNESQD